FPLLTKRQRYLVHQCAKESDLRCLSSGRDDARVLSVYPMEGHRFFRGGIYTDSFCIKLQDNQAEIFKNYLTKYPITKYDVDKHYESPSSAEEAAANQRPIRIVCTQPRRLPAIAVAERVSKERGECLGSTVGYHIRLEQRTSPETVLTYCTSGVLLRMLTVDSYATNISHIILDEIHEREQNTDYLLIALREALKQRKDLKVILMSATMEGNRETFMNYFQKSNIGAVDIPSRLFEVDKYFLDDVLAMTGYITTGNADTSGFKVDNWDYDAATNLRYPTNQFGHSIHPSASTPAFSSNIVMDTTTTSQLAKPYNRQGSAIMTWNMESYPYMINWSNDTQMVENAALKTDYWESSNIF
uniref:Helicase ATP-binding domain-containing protein n=1 Tax=Panagrolaimus sp. JU765 TaxID=591449 RepID=A0AC34QAY9_9BILA